MALDSFSITRPDFGANPAIFVKEVISELKKVNWPSRAQTAKLTLVVIGVSVFLGAYLGGLDIFFAKLIEILLKR